MSAYKRATDVIPCPDTITGEHDWLDSRQCSDQLYSGECAYCAALLIQHWWGWEFFTGEEHFDHDAWSFEEIRRITRPRRKGYLAEEEDVEDVPMCTNPVPVQGQTRRRYRPQEEAPEIHPMRPALMAEDFDQGPLVRFEPPPFYLPRRAGNENWGIFGQAALRGMQAAGIRICTNVGEEWNGIEVRNDEGQLI